MEEYKGNSNKAKEQQKALPPEKKVEKIVSGPVKSKKKNSKLSVNTFRLMSEKILLHGFQTDGTRFEFEKQTAMNLYFRLITEKTGSSRQLTVF